jgi:hypothetical protein
MWLLPDHADLFDAEEISVKGLRERDASGWLNARGSGTPAADGAIGVGCIPLAARRLGFEARALKASRHNLAKAPAPFLVVGRVLGDVWLATERRRDHLVLAESGRRARRRVPLRGGR